jgi:MFS transporter, SP family, arabinose:H+ symporter
LRSSCVALSHSPQPALVGLRATSNGEALAVLKSDGRSRSRGRVGRHSGGALAEEHATPTSRSFAGSTAIPLFLAITIGAFNQLAGINAILYYLNNIFAAAGFSQISSDQQAVAIGRRTFWSSRW